MPDELEALRYTKFRVLDAAQTKPISIIGKWARWLNGAEVRQLVERTRIASLRTLWCEP